MPKITGTIVTHNEERRIARAIQSLKCADEVVVVDDGSTDRTREIAAEMGARVVVHPWEGFVAQKNFADECATHDWIVNLDADEELDGVAQTSVGQVRAVTEPSAAGFRFVRHAQFMGKWIRHSGWYPDYKVRLYDRRQARRGGGRVHESVRVAGRVVTLAGEILHYTHETAESLRAQLGRAAEAMAQEMVERGERPGWLVRRLAAPWRWVSCYVVRAGLLDGAAGWVIAREEAGYVGRKMSRLEELWRERG